MLKCYGDIKEQTVSENVRESAGGGKLLVRNCVIFTFLTHSYLFVPLCQHESCFCMTRSETFFKVITVYLYTLVFCHGALY